MSHLIQMIDLRSIKDSVIPMDSFQLKWRFTELKYDLLPNEDLAQLIPLNERASAYLWTSLSDLKIHYDYPLNKELFKTIRQIRIQTDNDSDVRAWLKNLGIPDKPVYLNWDKENSMIVPMSLLIKYYSCFFYPASDDLTVFDENLDWVLFFRHDEQIFFGCNRPDRFPSGHDGPGCNRGSSG